MVYLLIWFAAAAFTYGFSATPGDKPSLGMQMLMFVVTMFAWPLLLGFAVRQAIEKQ